MPKEVMHFCDLANGDKIATDIANRFDQWDSNRDGWIQEKRELRNYLFQTDTTKTSNATLPWKNTTATPKITQIRDNLHANYMAALFPTSKWLYWEGKDSDAETRAKREAIIGYMQNKLEQSGFQETISRLVLDYIDYGNAFAEVQFVDETHMDEDGAMISVYRGPKVVRISPFDIVFNPIAPDFKSTPKITRYLVSHGTLASWKKDADEERREWVTAAFEKVDTVRTKEFYGRPEVSKSEGLQIDGFSSIQQYLESGMVEILEFEGDIYDEESKEFLHGYRILVADRSFVIYKAPVSSWLGRSSKQHIGWRLRPDNLYAMGPLDNLVGLQYRIDHLENLKADVFDQIATPVVFERGTVDDWRWGPGERIYGDENSDVKVLAPDTTALNADFQIQNIMNIMEEMAGAPKQAMGIRTPGEKTAYEVQTLENAAGRIFQSKVRQFEKEFMEPLLNHMLEVARRHMDVSETYRAVDSDIGVVSFRTITRKDIQAKGKLTPKGARHFAERANAVQTINAFTASPLYQDEDVRVHFSGKELAKTMAQLLDIGDPEKIVQEFIRISERAEAATQAQAGESQVLQNAATVPELQQ